MPQLRVSLIPWTFTISLSEDGQIGGTHGGPFDTVCSLMNTTYFGSLPDQMSWGDCNETSCSGMFSPLMTDDSDVALGPHSLLNTFAQHFEPGTPISFDQLIFITGMRVPYGVDSKSVLKIFDTGMYVTLILLPWVIAGLVILVARLHNSAASDSATEREFDISNLVTAGYQTILNQSAQYNNKTFSSRLIVVSYMLVALFVTILYSSFVKASMMTTPPTKRISYLRELVKEKNLKPLVASKTYVTDLIRTQADENPDYYALNRIFEEQGLIDVVQDITSVASTEAILNGTAFTISTCSIFKYYYYNSWKELSKTHDGFYYCGKDVILSAHTTWYFNRNTVSKDFINEFNRKTRWLLESPQKYVREHELAQIPSWIRVHDTPVNEEKADPISVRNIMGSILIYYGGISLACGFFVFEYSVFFGRMFP